MQFDHNYKPNRDGLEPTIAAMMDRVFYARRSQGMNVQWKHENGTLDEWSFADMLRADQFLAKCQRDGLDAVISN